MIPHWYGAVLLAGAAVGLVEAERVEEHAEWDVVLSKEVQENVKTRVQKQEFESKGENFNNSSTGRI